MTDIVIEARGLTKRFGKVVALDALDLEVPAGTSLGVLGPAGSGKSTLVRLLAGLVHPSAGTLTIGGSPAGSVDARRRLGVLLQDAQVYGWMTGREALAFAADLAAVPAEHMTARIDDVASQVSLSGLLDRRGSELAAPARGRLAIAMALVGEPEVLVLDAPFQPLDPVASREVLDVLSGVRGRTTIVLTADRPEDIEALCDRLVVLEDGRQVLAASGPKLASSEGPSAGLPRS